MADLVIGHTTHDSARIWVRGDEKHDVARIALSSARGSIATKYLLLGAYDDFTRTVDFGQLDPATRYTVRARFASSWDGLDGSRAAAEATGRLRTFPPPGTDAPFGFLHGSCNLSIVSLGNLGAMAAAALGTLAAAKSLERAAQGSLLWRLALWLGNGLVYVLYGGLLLAQTVWFALRWVWSLLARPHPPERPTWNEKASLVYAVAYLVYRLTGFKQTRPLPFLHNPYRRLRQLVDCGLRDEATPQFMIHAGDQIYFDFPFPSRAPTPAAYRLAYREAFFEDDGLRCFLTRCPQYMILDDHEIVDGFATDGSVPKKRDPGAYLEAARGAYREYVDSRHPSAKGSLFYHFDHGRTRFFVLDTRTERSEKRGKMIGPEQQRRLEQWLTDHAADVKFIVSSVPFVAELSSRRSEASAKPDQRDDKWCGPPFRAQRDEIIRFLHANGIGRVVFLVGDMHCCYHATMRIGWPHDRVTVHELAGGPVHQLQFGSLDDFVDQHRGFADPDEKIPMRTSLQQFHGAASGVLHVTVSPGAAPEVRWRVVRTSLDPEVETSRGQARSPLSGRIRFEEQRHA
jgi:hypothetical protein